jgi:hypothetical protein
MCHVGLEFDSVRIKLTEYFHILLGLFFPHLKKHNWSDFVKVLIACGMANANLLSV